jgi:hypothetical protein
MATNIEEALQEAITEIELKEYVKLAVVDPLVNEEKPGNYVRKRLNVLHKVGSGDYTYSGKDLYINKGDFTYLWHYGGNQMESISTPFRDIVDNGIEWLKTTLEVAYVEVVSCNEVEKIASVTAYKGTTGYFADSYNLKVWEVSPGVLDFKVISHTIVS